MCIYSQIKIVINIEVRSHFFGDLCSRLPRDRLEIPISIYLRQLLPIVYYYSHARARVFLRRRLWNVTIINPAFFSRIFTNAPSASPRVCGPATCIYLYIYFPLLTYFFTSLLYYICIYTLALVTYIYLIYVSINSSACRQPFIVERPACSSLFLPPGKSHVRADDDHVHIVVVVVVTALCSCCQRVTLSHTRVLLPQLSLYIPIYAYAPIPLTLVFFSNSFLRYLRYLYYQ